MRLAVVQKGSYGEFEEIVRAMLKKLARDGFLNLPSNLPADFKYDDPKVWQALSEASRNSCIAIIGDGLYSSGWDHENWKWDAARLKNRILMDRDIDLLLGMGLATGMEFADPKLGIAVMIADAASPETAGIIGRGEFSDKPNVHVQKYPKRISMAIRNYHNIFKFKNLGMIVDRNEAVRKMQSVDVVAKVANEENFNFHYCIGDIFDAANPLSRKEFIRCRNELKDKIDALFLPIFNGVPRNGFFDYIAPLLEKNVIVISEGDIEEVRKGALVSLVEADHHDSGFFEADVMERIILGARPEAISQYYNTNLAFCLNLKTAKLLRWKPSFELLMSVEYLFDTIDFY
ncbi:MAG: hypothetical protein IJ523_11340 [Succinivibrionaceae bacterium]|nr:hypothetical protein [Succinivibrionaceae bacterium]